MLSGSDDYINDNSFKVKLKMPQISILPLNIQSTKNEKKIPTLSKNSSKKRIKQAMVVSPITVTNVGSSNEQYPDRRKKKKRSKSPKGRQDFN